MIYAYSTNGVLSRLLFSASVDDDCRQEEIVRGPSCHFSVPAGCLGCSQANADDVFGERGRECARECSSSCTNVLLNDCKYYPSFSRIHAIQLGAPFLEDSVHEHHRKAVSEPRCSCTATPHVRQTLLRYNTIGYFSGSQKVAL